MLFVSELIREGLNSPNWMSASFIGIIEPPKAATRGEFVASRKLYVPLNCCENATCEEKSKAKSKRVRVYRFFTYFVFYVCWTCKETKKIKV